MSTYHTPVMVREVCEGLGVRPHGTYVDATVGGGGYAQAIVERGGRVLGIDADPDAISCCIDRFGIEPIAGTVLVGEDRIPIYTGRQIVLANGNFRNISRIAEVLGYRMVDGVVFDLGVSSHQLDTPDRGFSYRAPDARLDMRMTPDIAGTAADILNTYPYETLVQIFEKYAEDTHSDRLARRVVSARKVKRFVTVRDFLEAIGPSSDSYRSRVFQALRIEVNSELESLRLALDGARSILGPNGRIAVVSFHSLEDRIVKRELASDRWSRIGKDAKRATESEIRENPRSRSAKVRIAEKRET